MLQNVKLVVDDPALWHPLLQALPNRFPHVDARGSNRTSLKRTQMLLEKLVQRFFFAATTAMIPSATSLHSALRATPLPISAEEFLATRDARLIPQGKLRMAV